MGKKIKINPENFGYVLEVRLREMGEMDLNK